MKKTIRIPALVLVLVMALHMLPAALADSLNGSLGDYWNNGGAGGTVEAREDPAPAQERAAIAMLNHLAVVSERIRASGYDPLVLEDVYDGLVNDMDPSMVDARTLKQINDLTDVVSRCRLFTQKREHALYLLEQSRAQAAADAFETAVMTGGGFGSRILRGYDAWSRADEKALQVYGESGRKLDEEEQQALHRLRMSTFGYMVEAAAAFGLEGGRTLNEEAVQAFVRMESEPNAALRARLLESGKDTYRDYGGYWLLMARTCYALDRWQDCLDAVEAYLRLDIRIFRRDRELARVMPLAMEAAAALSASDAEYIGRAAPCLEILLDNSSSGDWELRFCAAVTLLDFSRHAPDAGTAALYFGRAYDVLTASLPELVWEQRRLNARWTAPVETVPVSEGLTAAEAEERRDYNQRLAAERATELPPVYEPLMLFIRALRDMRTAAGASFDTRAAELDAMLHPGGEVLFLNEYRESLSRFTERKQTAWGDTCAVSTRDTVRYAFWGGYQYDPVMICVPVSLVDADTKPVLAAVRSGDGAAAAVLTDAKLVGVRRNTADPAMSLAVYQSASLDAMVAAYRFQPDSSSPIRMDLAWKLYGNTVEGRDRSVLHLGYENKYDKYTLGSWYYGSHLPYYSEAGIGGRYGVSGRSAEALLSAIPEAPAEDEPLLSLRPVDLRD